jgi:hypothetical protein
VETRCTHGLPIMLASHTWVPADAVLKQFLDPVESSGTRLFFERVCALDLKAKLY